MREIFSSLLGNSYIKNTLAEDILHGRASHAYILAGPTGSGKHTAARLIAAASVCENRNREELPLPCGTCPNCNKILKNISPDVFWIGSGDKASVSVEQIRQMRQSLYISPNDGDRKFYILEDAHTMTVQAQNALLLSLEEPPPFVTFLLLSEDPASLLETIRSRAPVISMELFSPSAVMEYIGTQTSLARLMAAEPEKCTGAAVLSGGALGQAITLLTEDESNSGALQLRKLSITLLEGIFSGRTSDLLTTVHAELPKSRDAATRLFVMMQSALRDLIARKRGSTVDGQFLLGGESVCRFSGKYSLSRLIALYSLCTTAISRLESNGSVLACMTSFAVRAKRI